MALFIHRRENMKSRIRIKEKGKPDIIREIEIPDKDHLAAQIKYKHTVIQSKKYKLERKRKYKIDYHDTTDSQS